MKNQLRWSAVIIFAVASILGCSRPQQSTGAHVPQDWVQLPEDGTSAAFTAETNPAAEQELNDGLAEIFKVSSDAIESLPASAPEQTVMSGTHPKDWTPWHLEAVTTDLAVTLKGMVGLTTLQGTPAIQTFWRHQGSAPAKTSSFEETDSVPTLSFSNTEADLSKQMEPLIKAALNTGKIHDSDEFRRNVMKSAGDFQSLTKVLDASQPALNWFVSGLRLDISVNGSGKVTWADSLGGDARFRFEWKRLRKPAATSKLASVGTTSTWAANLGQFANLMSQDLEVLTDSPDLGPAFKASAFRIGLGVTASGKWGVIKAGGSALGHINFSRDVKKPVVYPVHPAPSHEPLLVFESGSDARHIDFAQSEGVNVMIAKNFSNVEESIFHVDRERFRKGLRRALHMGAPFANAASRSSGPGWKVYALKAGFDLSVVGTLGLSKAGGLASTEITLLNTKF